MKLKPAPKKLDRITITNETNSINDVNEQFVYMFNVYADKMDEIIDYQEYLREIVQNLEDNRRNK